MFRSFRKFAPFFAVAVLIRSGIAAPEDGVGLPSLKDFEVVRDVSGNPGKEGFLAFVPEEGEIGTEPDGAGNAAAAVPEGPESATSAFDAAMRRGGLPLLFLALVAAGFMLNLTPCALPLVPVNLAILGIGGFGRSGRAAGAAVGVSFGAGMAVCYGALGLVSAKTSALFGSHQGSPVFAASAAVVFSLLSLASLGVFRLDFSRLGNALRKKRSTVRGAAAANRTGIGAARLAAAFAAGAGSAALAGACVAPALVSALVLSADLSERGIAAGAFVPFALGSGMALPWPFLGAGLATLPKPGRWMERVNHVFAAVFLAAAAFYAVRAWRLAVPPEKEEKPASADAGEGGIEWLTDATAAAVVADATGKPLLIHFSAEWCPACKIMEKTTLADPDVVSAVGKAFGPAVLEVDCTDTSDPEVRRLLSMFGVRGIPYTAILEKRKTSSQRTTSNSIVGD